MVLLKVFNSRQEAELVKSFMVQPEDLERAQKLIVPVENEKSS